MGDAHFTTMILAQVQVAFGMLLFMALLLLCGFAFVVFLGVFAIAKLRPGVIGMIAAIVLLVVLLVPAAIGVFQGLSHSPRPQPQAVQDVQADVVAKRAVVRVEGANGKSLDEAWEELNKPRIDLPEEQPADGEAASAAGEEAPASENAAASESDEVATDSPAADPAPAEPRPAWVDELPKRVGNTWREVLVTEEYATREECYRDADRKLFAATYNRLRTLNNESVVDFEADARRQRQSGYTVFESDLDFAINSVKNLLQQMGLGIDYIRRQIAQDEYFETNERSFGPMVKLYTQIEFTPAVDRELRTRWDAFQRQERLVAVGMGAGGVLGLLGMAFALLQIDTATKGYYTKRLFLGVPAAIIGIVTLVIAALNLG